MFKLFILFLTIIIVSADSEQSNNNGDINISVYPINIKGQNILSGPSFNDFFLKGRSLKYRHLNNDHYLASLYRHFSSKLKMIDASIAANILPAEQPEKVNNQFVNN